MMHDEIFDLSKLDNKKHQHYVSRFYLNFWLTKKYLQVVRTAEGVTEKFKKKDTNDIAVQNYFYNLEVDSEVWLMLNCIFEEKSATNPLINKILNDIFLLKVADDVLNKGIGIVNENKKVQENAQEILKHLKRHHLENAYEKIESAVSKEIKEFTASHGNHLQRRPTETTFRHLLVFYCLQLFRTKHKINEASEYIESMHLRSNYKKIILTDTQKEAVLKVLLFVSSFELCLALESAGCVMRISVNKTEEDYVTTDCPAMYFDKPKAVPGFKAYGIMPLSPRLFMNICIPHTPSGNGSLLLQYMESEHLVRETNRLTKSQAYEFVFSTAS
jgi:hypothetical protein